MEKKRKGQGKAKVPSSPGAGAGRAGAGQGHTRADTKQDSDFQRYRFEWAAGVLERQGLTARVNAARTPRELDAIPLDDHAVEVEIIAVLHSEKREAHFVGLSGKQLKHILRN